MFYSIVIQLQSLKLNGIHLLERWENLEKFQHDEEIRSKKRLKNSAYKKNKMSENLIAWDDANLSEDMLKSFNTDPLNPVALMSDLGTNQINQSIPNEPQINKTKKVKNARIFHLKIGEKVKDLKTALNKNKVSDISSFDNDKAELHPEESSLNSSRQSIFLKTLSSNEFESNSNNPLSIENSIFNNHKKLEKNTLIDLRPSQDLMLNASNKEKSIKSIPIDSIQGKKSNLNKLHKKFSVKVSLLRDSKVSHIPISMVNNGFKAEFKKSSLINFGHFPYKEGSMLFEENFPITGDSIIMANSKSNELIQAKESPIVNSKLTPFSSPYVLNVFENNLISSVSRENSNLNNNMNILKLKENSLINF